MAGLSMLPDPIEGSFDWAKAGEATMVATTTTAIRLFIKTISLMSDVLSDRASVIAASADQQPSAYCRRSLPPIRRLLRHLALDIQVPPRALRDDGGVHVVIALQRSHRVGKPRLEISLLGGSIIGTALGGHGADAITDHR